MPKFKEAPATSTEDIRDFFAVTETGGPISTRQAGGASPALERNKAAARRILEAFNTGNSSLVDEAASPSLMSHTAYPGTSPTIDGLKAQLAVPRNIFPDVHFEEELMIAEGNMVFLRWKMTGTHKGRAFGREPTGRRITHYGHEIIKFDDNGKVIEHIDTNDIYVFLDKLGLLDAQMLEQLRRFGVKHPTDE